MKEENPWAGGFDSLNTVYTWLPLCKPLPEWLWGGW